jgi:hypothetical protein
LEQFVIPSADIQFVVGSTVGTNRADRERHGSERFKNASLDINCGPTDEMWSLPAADGNTNPTPRPARM